jgi:hypothetical protein
MEREFQRVEERKRELRESRKEVAVDPDPIMARQEAHQKETREEEAVDPGSKEEHYQRARKLLSEITEENRDETKAEIMKLQIESVEEAQKDILAARAHEARESKARERAEWAERERLEEERRKLLRQEQKTARIRAKEEEQKIQQEVEKELAGAILQHEEFRDQVLDEIHELEMQQKVLKDENFKTEVKVGKFDHFSSRRAEEISRQRVTETLAKCTYYQENRRKEAELSLRIKELKISVDNSQRALNQRRKKVADNIREGFPAWW